jgi:hypothetical protein
LSVFWHCSDPFVIVARVAQHDHSGFRTIAIVLLIVSECANHARHSGTMGFKLSTFKKKVI